MNRRLRILALTAFILGLALRLVLCALAPRYGYTWDHLDNIGMGRTARRVGLLNVYSVDRTDLATVVGFAPTPASIGAGRESREDGPLPSPSRSGGRGEDSASPEARSRDQGSPPLRPPGTIARTAVVLPNYPPWAMTLFFAQARLLDIMTGHAPVNTFVSRLVLGAAPFMFELLTAFGLFLLARALDAGERTGLIAAVLFWCAPPTAMNSASWGQVDAFVLAPAVFLVLFLVERRFVLAGATLGAAMLLKPQGLILAPIALFGLVIAAFAQCSDRRGARPALEPGASPARHAGNRGERWRVALRAFAAASIRLAGSAAVVVAAGSLPWTLAHGTAWLTRSYVQSFVELAPDTTCFAFNVWYLDALRLDDRIVFALDSTARLAGMTKDAWGRLLLLAAGALAGLACWRLVLDESRSHTAHRLQGLGAPSARAVTVFACLWLWSVFLFPTRVHERYIMYCIPFLILMAVIWRSYRGVLVVVLLLAAAEQSWNLWLAGPPAGSLLPRQGTIELSIRHAMNTTERAGGVGSEAGDAAGAAAGFATSDAHGSGDSESTARGVEEEKQRLLLAAPARQDAYRAARARVYPWDAILTLLSIGAYVWAFVVTMRGPDSGSRKQWVVGAGPPA